MGLLLLLVLPSVLPASRKGPWGFPISLVWKLEPQGGEWLAQLHSLAQACIRARP